MVGDQVSIDQFAKLIGGDTRQVDETNMVPFLIGLVLGIALGLIPLRLPNGMTIKLGAAGGAFLVSLILGHFGRVGPVPGLCARGGSKSVAGARVDALPGRRRRQRGTQLAKVVGERGWGIFAAAALITVVAVAITLLLTFVVYRMNILSTMGLTAGVMTNPPALAAANALTTTDVPAVIYASAFPVVLIFKILLAQLLVQMLRIP